MVSDRSIYSSLAYQGFGRGLPLSEVRAVNEWAIGGCWPDLVILLDVPADQLARRMHRRELDRFERSGPEFYERVAEGFRLLAAEEPERWVVVDGDRPMEEVAIAVRNAVRARARPASRRAPPVDEIDASLDNAASLASAGAGEGRP